VPVLPKRRLFLNHAELLHIPPGISAVDDFMLKLTNYHNEPNVTRMHQNIFKRHSPKSMSNLNVRHFHLMGVSK